MRRSLTAGSLAVVALFAASCHPPAPPPPPQPAEAVHAIAGAPRDVLHAALAEPDRARLAGRWVAVGQNQPYGVFPGVERLVVEAYESDGPHARVTVRCEVGPEWPDLVAQHLSNEGLALAGGAGRVLELAAPRRVVYDTAFDPARDPRGFALVNPHTGRTDFRCAYRFTADGRLQLATHVPALAGLFEDSDRWPTGFRPKVDGVLLVTFRRAGPATPIAPPAHNVHDGPSQIAP